MITIISSTNRPDSHTLKIAMFYLQLLEKQGVKARVLSLEHLPHTIAFSDLFGKRSSAFQQIIDEFIIPAEKFVFVAPEYNGSFPGILKVFLDAVHPDLNRNKKAALIGVSSGRAGNLRGMEHLTGVLNYLGIHVHPNKVPVSSVTNLMNAEGQIKDENTIKILEKHAIDLINY